MASQKVAVELLKVALDASSFREGGTAKFLDQQDLWSRFTGLTQLVDEDVVLAGDNAEANIRQAPNRATEEVKPKASLAVVSDKLNTKQQEKMLQFLEQFVVSAVADKKEEKGKVPQPEWKLKLWTMELPDSITHFDLVKRLTVEQGQEIHKYVVEALEPAPDAA